MSLTFDFAASKTSGSREMLVFFTVTFFMVLTCYYKLLLGVNNFSMEIEW